MDARADRNPRACYSRNAVCSSTTLREAANTLAVLQSCQRPERLLV